MDLPVNPPVRPMLAKAVAGLPERDDLIFEPKWDGFRCIVFRDGDEVELGSRNERPLTRYFPELIEPIRRLTPERCVIDGELIVASKPDGSADDSATDATNEYTKLDFDGLQQRIHPAESRINMLAEKTPAAFIAFDLLAIGDEDLRDRPFSERRARLEEALANTQPPVYLTPTTTDHDTAARWFTVFEGAGLDGLIAKPINDRYVENKRTQLKVKHVRSADAVVAGYRWHKDGKGVGSLLLGLYNESGVLHHVGVAASFTAKRRAELVDELAPLTEGALEAHPWREWAEADAHLAADGRMPGAPHRWSGQKDHSWVPLLIEKVAEVKYGSTLNGRFREVTKMLRWRPDKTPAECDFSQLDEPEPIGLGRVLHPD
ncbi:MAG: ATP-dependent DNA ligase [Acidimicrobiia bacterium]|nr:ATP-dependent DNA ligase [Acidimicrobiia bacterium]